MNPKRNPDSPWNPLVPADITPTQYELQVVKWLKAGGDKLESFTIEHLSHLSGTGGDYELDAVAEFQLLQGARIRIAVECKRYSGPVKRDTLLTLWAKLDAIKAHKGMIFATCGFQSGALDYAAEKGIATIAFVNGSFLYETKSFVKNHSHPHWPGLPNYSGIMMTSTDGDIRCQTIDAANHNGLGDWIRS